MSNLKKIVYCETTQLIDVLKLNYPFCIFDNGAVYSIDNVHVLHEWLENKEGELQAEVLSIELVIKVENDDS